jgi:hypothetical protein
MVDLSLKRKAMAMAYIDQRVEDEKEAQRKLKSSRGSRGGKR